MSNAGQPRRVLAAMIRRAVAAPTASTDPAEPTTADAYGAAGGPASYHCFLREDRGFFRGRTSVRCWTFQVLGVPKAPTRGPGGGGNPSRGDELPTLGGYL